MPETQARVTIWGIEVFLAVADEGSISAAARRLGVSPSAISQQLGALETTLGATLFDRAARPLALTVAGGMFRRHAQAIERAEAEGRAELARADLSRLTTLRLGMIEDFDAEVTPALLADLAGSMHDCRFLLETGASHRLLDGLESRSLDLVVAAEMGRDAADTGWREVHPLLRDPFVAVRPRGGQKAGAGAGLILYSQRYLMGRQIAAHLARQATRPAVRFELDSYNAILALVASGEGWTILTPLALHHAARFLAQVEVLSLADMGLDGAAMDRTISLSARAGALGDVPQRVAASLHPHIARAVVQPACHRWPWLAPHLVQFPAKMAQAD